MNENSCFPSVFTRVLYFILGCNCASVTDAAFRGAFKEA